MQYVTSLEMLTKEPFLASLVRTPDQKGRTKSQAEHVPANWQEAWCAAWAKGWREGWWCLAMTHRAKPTRWHTARPGHF
jgi:hypothetical protein